MKEKKERVGNHPALKIKASTALVSPDGKTSPLFALLYRLTEHGTGAGGGMECVRLGHRLAMAKGTFNLEESDLALLKKCMGNKNLVLLPWARFSLQCLLWPHEVAESDMEIFNHWQAAAKS